ncbi:hypothetical protein N8J89_03665 [Crossiella sp. CA-258035]|uniref:hypothetical protein n=1 Tax=Crossiella sp. CA-258035 TaxID=2981138 RepID=UPI0024BCB6E0|nr:hypothetical protein [Crossiella sp. CA-258035]WHT20182.1 hypothetical protein N8J89_03665 [Crossiella sp. CA-258035]
MTSYSILPTGPRYTVLATWPGEPADTSTKVTTLNDSKLAEQLAPTLTQLSEDAWDAAAWLDTSPSLETAISQVIEQLRSPAESMSPIDLTAEPAARHGDQWSFFDAKDLLAHELPEIMNAMTRPQRLTIADELATDAAARAEALQLLPTGLDPDDPASRIWQMCEVTRSERNGQTGPLPEGAAGWLVRSWGPYLVSPAMRWGARDRLVRIEQLAAACLAHGGVGDVEDDPLQARLVMPRPPGNIDAEAYYVTVHEGRFNSWDTDPFHPMTVSRKASGETQILGKLDATDDDGFAELLGEWTRMVPFNR